MSAEPLVDQLVRAMVAVVNHSEDVPTVRDWSVLVGRSRSGLYALCDLVGVLPKCSLDLARLLRASRRADIQSFGQAFLVADPRTIRRLLKRAGCLVVDVAHLRDDLLERQRLVTDPRVISRIAHFLRDAR
jgi:hypothetical protein